MTELTCLLSDIDLQWACISTAFFLSLKASRVDFRARDHGQIMLMFSAYPHDINGPKELSEECIIGIVPFA